MYKTVDKVVLRLARTLPRKSHPGIGLHCYHYTRLSKRRTLIVTKHLDSPLLSLQKDTDIVEINYRDLSLTREKLTLFDVALVGFTKLYGDFRLFVATLYTLVKKKFGRK